MSDTYEVQTLKDGRWMIEQRCQTEEHAVSEAHDLHNTGAFRSVKVLKEIHDTVANLYRETVVLQLRDNSSGFANASGNFASRPTAQNKGQAPRATKAPSKAAPRKRFLLDFFRD